MPRPPVTVIIHTLNEIEQIEECLRTVEWADEIYLVDSLSTDGTVPRVREKFPKARIEEREYLGAASTKNYAIDRASHDWIFVIDADERVTPELRDEIFRTLEGPLDHWAYSVGRRNFMLGKEVKYSGLQRDRVTRLFHRGHARYPNKRVHADLVVDGPTFDLRHKMLHYYIRSFDHMIAKMTRYANWGAAQMYIDGKTTGLWGIFSHTLGKFVRDFFFNGGFLDGTRGLISVGMHVYYTFWKYAKLWELTQLARLGKPVPLPRLDEEEGRWELPWLKNAVNPPSPPPPAAPPRS
ncbi:MAG TPA: glycosyltransferase family 2 protein [Thermoanaerobaculia bacterium]|jgi:glycosyltransferase involved in cell wall biosynthesis|nr:glycosyltransferase family 2 protein [Thermoanaerobaculia bacterium]